MQKTNALLSKANLDTLPKEIIVNLINNAGKQLESSDKTPKYH
jgi:hypothetical protein